MALLLARGVCIIHFCCGFLFSKKVTRAPPTEKAAAVGRIDLMMKFRNTTSQLRDFASDEWKRGAPALRQFGFEYI